MCGCIVVVVIDQPLNIHPKHKKVFLFPLKNDNKFGQTFQRCLCGHACRSGVGYVCICVSVFCVFVCVCVCLCMWGACMCAFVCGVRVGAFVVRSFVPVR